MKYLRIDRYIFSLENIGSASFFSKGQDWYLGINYKDGNSLNILLKDEESCIQALDKLADTLSVC